jgi:hypothetical protein
LGGGCMGFEIEALNWLLIDIGEFKVGQVCVGKVGSGLTWWMRDGSCGILVEREPICAGRAFL